MNRLSRNRLRDEGAPKKRPPALSPAAVGVCSCAGLRACLSRGSLIERGSTWNASGQGPVPSNWRSAAQPLRTLIIRHWITSCSGKANPSQHGVYVPPPGSFPEDRRPRLIARLIGERCSPWAVVARLAVPPSVPVRVAARSSEYSRIDNIYRDPQEMVRAWPRSTDKLASPSPNRPAQSA